MDELCFGKSDEAVLDDDGRFVRPVAPQRFAVEDLFFSSARNFPGGLFFDRREGPGDVRKSSLRDGSKDENQNETAHHRLFGVCQSGAEQSARQEMESTDLIVSLNG